MRTIATLLADRAARHPDRTFLRWEGARTSYADAAEQSFRHGNAFLACGVRPGDHVALFLDNGPEFYWCLWGLGAIGAVAVPLNTAARGDLLRYYLERSDARWIVTEPALEERITGPAARVIGIAGAFRVGAATVGPLDRLGVPVVGVEVLRSGAAHRPDVTVAETDVHGIFFTSGTTGPSKGVLSPQSQPIAIAEQTVTSFGYRPDDVLYTCLPLFHVNALWYTSYAALWAGATVALGRRFSASGFWDEVRESGATVISSLGSMTNILLKAPESPADRDHTVRTAFLVPTGREVVERFESRFGVGVVSGFGATETFLVSALGPERDPAAPLGSAGAITPYAQVRIADEHGRPVAPGSAGEILVRPVDVGTVMLGYHGMAEATRNTFRDLWFRSGDRGFLDEEGYLHFVDRIKDSIRRRGENISAHEVELLIGRHPAVLEVAAVAVPAEMSEDEVLVFVVPRPGHTIDPAELVESRAHDMAYFMVPRYVHVLDELPKTASERVEKFRLREWALEHLHEIWDREQAGLEVRR